MSNENHKSKAVRVYIEGRVQGVGFRYFVYKHARRKGVSGWVKNLEDSRVEAHFEGAAEEVDALVELCREGPVGAKVKHLEQQEATPEATGAPFNFKYD
ncbi:MAG: acylphosphatase [Cyclonatronaceae bacterium]